MFQFHDAERFWIPLQTLPQPGQNRDKFTTSSVLYDMQLADCPMKEPFPAICLSHSLAMTFPHGWMTDRGVLDCVFLVQGFTGFSGPNPAMTGPKALRGATVDSYVHPDWISDGLKHLLSQGHYKSDTPS